jgi:exonuclease SbcD
MRCRFLHLSDIHLGYQQYGHQERFNDFGRAFEYIVRRAVEEQVDFVVLAGDLFHKRAIDPPTLLQAVNWLELLKQEGIPVLAIEGNHDRSHYQDVISWMDFLADRGYLMALRPSFQNGKAVLKAWDGFTGAYADLRPRRDPQGVVRVYGTPYYGAVTKQVLQMLRDALAEMDHRHVDYVVMMLHAGPDDVLPRYFATVPQSVLTPLREFVHYLAMGHIHKPYERENWIFNPGSPETCSIEETAWPERGFYLVEVDTAADPLHRPRRIQNPRRSFLQVRVHVDRFQNVDRLYQALADELEKQTGHPPPPRPVVEVVLEGVWQFAAERVDVERVRAIVGQQLEPLLVRVTNRTVARGTFPAEESASYEELVQRALQGLFEQDARYRPQAAQWAHLALDLKRMVLEGSSPQSIVEYVQHQLEEHQLHVSDV